MRALVLEGYGGPEVMRWTEVDDPEVVAGHVLVDIAASGVNRADIMQREGNYPPPAGDPPYPGLELSGRISALGAGVSGHAVGDQVCALVGGGGYAEKVAIPAAQLLSVPRGVSLIDAGALPEAACTAWLGMFTLGKLRAGESVLVNGGSSGIGTMAIQLGKAVGARVFATAGTSEKMKRCRELGADVAINYRTEQFAERIREETGGAGVDMVVDLIGGRVLADNVRSLATQGRLIAIGVIDGKEGQLDLVELMTRRRSILTLSLRRLPPPDKAAVVASVRDNVWPLIEQGKVKPVVDRRMPLRHAADAHKVMESGQHFGKIVLVSDANLRSDPD